MRKFLIPLLAGVLLAGCGHAPVKTGSTAPSGAVPSQPATGAVHYAVDAGQSEMRFLVYKAGALAAFGGHDHVVEARRFSGEIYLAPQFTDSSLSLTLPVKDFEVDRPAARKEEGPDFAKQPSPDDIKGTTTNMLGPGELDAERFPEVLIQSVKIAGTPAAARVTVRITLHGSARDLTVPVVVKEDGSALSAQGAFDLNQSEFGIKPFSAFGGGLQVADTIKVKFRIEAHRV